MLQLRLYFYEGLGYRQIFQPVSEITRSRSVCIRIWVEGRSDQVCSRSSRVDACRMVQHEMDVVVVGCMNF